MMRYLKFLTKTFLSVKQMHVPSWRYGIRIVEHHILYRSNILNKSDKEMSHLYLSSLIEFPLNNWK